MSGKKGRSGKIRTMSAKRARERAGSLGGTAKRDNALGLPSRPPGSMPSLRGRIEMLPGTCRYDAAVDAEATTYGEARLREQVMEQELKNEALRDENAVRRRKLFTEQRFLEYTDLVMGKLNDVSELCAGLVEPPKKTAARAVAKDWLDKLRTIVADALALERGRQ